MSDDTTRAEALKRSIAARILPLDLHNTQLLDAALTRIEHSTDRVRDSLRELREAHAATVNHAPGEAE